MRAKRTPEEVLAGFRAVGGFSQERKMLAMCARIADLEWAVCELIPLAQHAEYPEGDDPAVDRARELVRNVYYA